jgi:succinate dehydrogenase / fumarate reductase membrane anchor subunit
MSMRTPLARARGLGTAKDGTGHFWRQRLTAIANVPLVIAFVAMVALNAGADYGQARALVADPLAALVLLLLVGSGTYHMRLGMQVIIEDYVEAEGAKFAALIANNFFAVAVAAAAALAILRVFIGG